MWRMMCRTRAAVLGLVGYLLLLSGWWSVSNAQQREIFQEDIGVWNVFKGQGLGAGFNGTTIANAVTAIDGAKKMLFLSPGLPGTIWTISANLTIPDNVMLWVPRGSTMSINSGITVTVLASYRCDNIPCFTGAGTVVGFDEHGRRNVLHFGANPDDAVDDTAAVKMALRGIMGDAGTYFTNKGGGCLFFPLPAVIGGHYRLNDTIEFAEKWNVCVAAPARFDFNRATGASRQALIKWYGAAHKDVFLFHYTFGLTLTNISIDCLDVAGTAGISLGKRGETASSVRSARLDTVHVSYCDMGVAVGWVANNGPDVAPIRLDDVYLDHNHSAGLSIKSGNAVVKAYNLWAWANGAAPINGEPGANIHQEGGLLYLYDYTGLGGATTTVDPTDLRPVTADIYSGASGVQVIGAWSEVTRPFLVALFGNNVPTRVSGVRHWSGSFSDGNIGAGTDVPVSIIWQASDPLRVDGEFFGNIQVNAGVNSLVIDHGVKFITGSQHELGFSPTFTGTAIANQFAYVGMPSGEQHGQIAVGKPPRQDIGEDAFHRPYLQVRAPNLASHSAVCTEDMNGNGCGTQAYHYAMAEHDLIGNAYRTSTGELKSIQAGRMSLMQVLGSSPGAFVVRTDNATAAGQTKLSPGETIVEVSQVPNCVSTEYFITLGTHVIGWGSGAPTCGSFPRGSVVYNINAASGQASGWQCATATCTAADHWVSMPNLP